MDWYTIYNYTIQFQTNSYILYIQYSTILYYTIQYSHYIYYYLSPQSILHPQSARPTLFKFTVYHFFQLVLYYTILYYTILYISRLTVIFYIYSTPLYFTTLYSTPTISTTTSVLRASYTHSLQDLLCLSSQSIIFFQLVQLI